MTYTNWCSMLATSSLACTLILISGVPFLNKGNCNIKSMRIRILISKNPVQIPADYCWISVHQIKSNIETRSHERFGGNV